MRKGTSLLEVVVYLACCVLISTLAGHMILSVHKTIHDRRVAMDAALSGSLALNRMLEDLKKASVHHERWKLREKDAVIFSLNHQDCGWFVSKGRLIRVTGIYNKHTTTWSERAVSVILDSVESLSFAYRHNTPTILAGVKISLALKSFSSTKIHKGFIAFVKDDQ